MINHILTSLYATPSELSTPSHYSKVDSLLDEISCILNTYSNLLGDALEISDTQQSASPSEATGAPRSQGNSRDSINV